MTYAEPPAPRTRPGPVTASVYMLYTLAALQLISIILTAMSIGPSVDAARDYLPDTTEGDTALTFVNISLYTSIAFALLFGVGYLVLGVFVGKGKNAARIVTWVVLGISLCCATFALGGTALGNAMGGNSNASGIDQAELTQRIEDALPGWATPVNYTLAAVGIIMTLATIILLALPAANAYFRKQESTWEPPVPGATYPPPTS